MLTYTYIFSAQEKCLEMVDEIKSCIFLLAKVILNANERLELNGHFTLFFTLCTLRLTD